MKLTFGSKNAIVDVRECLRKTVKEFGEESLTPVKSPAMKGLKLIDEDSPRVREENRKKFHILVMLLMCVLQKGKRDI